MKRTRCFTVDGSMKTLGSDRKVHPAMKARCIGRMKNWCHLARLAIEAEFPNFDLLHLMSAFDVTPDASSRAVIAPSEKQQDRRQNLVKLGKALSLDGDALVEQFFAHLPSAVAKMRSNKCSNKDAWRAAVRARAAKASTAKPIDVLLQALCRYFAWSGSTSGVEQTFAKQLGKLSAQRSHLDDSLLDDELVLLTCHAEDDEDAIKNAQVCGFHFPFSSALTARPIRGEMNRVKTELKLQHN